MKPLQKTPDVYLAAAETALATVLKEFETNQLILTAEDAARMGNELAKLTQTVHRLQMEVQQRLRAQNA